MRQLRLVRVSECNGATCGVLVIDDAPEFVTLEDAWRDNERLVSCIPVGRYKIKPRISPKFGNTWQVIDVPQRNHILFHAGNTHRDTNGCILLGMQFGDIGEDQAILASRSAFNNFMRLMNGLSEAELLIIDAYGGGRVH
jgi:hypothetical protein